MEDIGNCLFRPVDTWLRLSMLAQTNYCGYRPSSTHKKENRLAGVRAEEVSGCSLAGISPSTMPAEGLADPHAHFGSSAFWHLRNCPSDHAAHMQLQSEERAS